MESFDSEVCKILVRHTDSQVVQEYQTNLIFEILAETLESFLLSFSFQTTIQFRQNYINISNFISLMNQNMGNSTIEPAFTIFHFNDVYDIQPNKQGKRGICNFQAYIRGLRKQFPTSLTLFSGDAFSPSVLTNIYDGEQMVYALNKIGIDVACYGNHQFDLDSEQTEKLAKSCNFPWLLGNLKYQGSEFILGNGIPYVTKQINGKKIGFFGVAGEDWLSIVSDEYEGQLKYVDVVEHSKKMCQILKKQQNCDMIVALTHMRVPQDRNLPEQVPEIDIVLGGHDHIIMKQFINQIPVIKSGDNFKKIGVIKVYEKQKNQNAQFHGRNYSFDVQIRDIPISEECDKQLSEYVDKCLVEYAKNDRIIGFTDSELNTQFKVVRTQQSNYGNFVADLVKLYHDCDCSALNSGCIRNDTMIKPGKLKYSQISNLINDVLVVKKVPGSVILEMLEYACAGCPDNYVGSFLLVSGIQYHFDYRQKPRVKYVAVNGKELNKEKIYTLATHSFIGRGGDGFDMLKQCEAIIDQTSGVQTLSLILKFFKGQNFNQTKKQEEIAEEYKIEEDDDELPDFPVALLSLAKKLSAKVDRINKLRNRFVIGPQGKRLISIAPTVDGRIKSLYP